MLLAKSIRVGHDGFLKRPEELRIVGCDRMLEGDLDRIELGLAETAEQSCLESEMVKTNGKTAEVIS